jgi:hypothetical protein
MQVDGKTLRQHGTLRLVALRAGVTAERYLLIQDGRVVAGGFPSLEAAVVRFERFQRAALRQAAEGHTGSPVPAATAGPGGALLGEAGDAGNVVSLEAYRRRRR